MKLATYSAGDKQLLGVVEGQAIIDVLSLTKAAGAESANYTSMLRLLQSGPAALNALSQLLANKGAAAKAARHEIKNVHLCAPVPNPSKIVAVGLNYREHCTEQGIKAPEAPLLFAKYPNSVTGPYDPIVIPKENPEVDYEVELGVVIGRRAKRVAEADAFSYVAGYLVLNDVSARKWRWQGK